MSKASIPAPSIATITAVFVLSGCTDGPQAPSNGFLDEVPAHFTLLHRDNVSALLVDKSGRVVNLAMTEDLYNVYRTTPWNSNVVPELTRRIFHYVYDDVFDFLILSFDPDAPRSDPPLGWNTPIRNDVQGLCWGLHSTGLYSTPPRLRSVIMLWRHGSLRNGPSLHEIAHTWGASLGLIKTVSGKHWGLAGVGGQLGGWVTGTLEELEPGLYRGSGPTGNPFHVIANGGNRVPYAPLELYSMGFLSRDSIPPIEVAVDGEVVDSMAGTFTASSIQTVTGDDLRCSDRVPSHLDAPREFGVLYVVLSAGPLAEDVLASIVADVEEFARPAADDREDLFNFWEATGGRATLRFHGLLEALF